VSPGSSLPDQANNLSWWATLAGIGSTILAMFAGMISLGRKIEYMEGKIQSHDQTVKDILKLFSDADGNPRFVTVLICDKKAAKCESMNGERFTHIGERITALVIEVAALRDDMKTTQDETLRAILQELRRGK